MRLNAKKFIMGFLRRSITLFAALILMGCAVGPDYIPPDPAFSPAWHSPLEGGLTPEDTDPRMLANWWTTLNDPELSGLIERAVAGNLDLKKAWAKVREARAGRGISSADLLMRPGRQPGAAAVKKPGAARRVSFMRQVSTLVGRWISSAAFSVPWRRRRRICRQVGRGSGMCWYPLSLKWP